MRINSRKIRKILRRVWTAPKRIFETFCTQEPLDASAWMQHSQLCFDSENQTKDFSYTIFPVKKINVGKVLKLWENCYLIILSIHILKLEISGCDNWLSRLVQRLFQRLWVTGWSDACAGGNHLFIRRYYFSGKLFQRLASLDRPINMTPLPLLSYLCHSKDLLQPTREGECVLAIWDSLPLDWGALS
jgi:hypothetical protein